VTSDCTPCSRDLADQLRRAASSIPLNIAEGVGEFAAADKPRFYRFARRSATESAAIIDALTALELADEPMRAGARGLLVRIVAMLTAMVLKLPGSGSGHFRALGSGSVPL
jgi:four helix bundle protein